MHRIANDPEALEAFCRAHVDRVQRFVARRTADPYLAADLTAEVFLAAIGSAHTYRSGLGEPAYWLYGIARNVVAPGRLSRAFRDRGAGPGPDSLPASRERAPKRGSLSGLRGGTRWPSTSPCCVGSTSAART